MATGTEMLAAIGFLLRGWSLRLCAVLLRGGIVWLTKCRGLSLSYPAQQGGCQQSVAEKAGKGQHGVWS